MFDLVSAIHMPRLMILFPFFPELDNSKLLVQTIAKAVGDWFYDRAPFQKIDCPYPCDKTCHNRVFDTAEHPLI